jgi:hypothetical protein
MLQGKEGAESDGRNIEVIHLLLDEARKMGPRACFSLGVLWDLVSDGASIASRGGRNPSTEWNLVSFGILLAEDNIGVGSVPADTPPRNRNEQAQ